MKNVIYYGLIVYLVCLVGLCYVRNNNLREVNDELQARVGRMQVELDYHDHALDSWRGTYDSCHETVKTCIMSLELCVDYLKEDGDALDKCLAKKAKHK